MAFLFTLLAIGFVIFIHELGHLLAAKRAKVGVSEFAIGIGPKLLSFNFDNTLYSLRLLPFGGFIKAKGLDDLNDCSIEEDYRRKSILSRMSIIVAGSVMNILLGFVVFTLISFFIGEMRVNGIVNNLKPGFPAEQAGVMAGDQLLRINGNPIQDVQADVISFIQASNGDAIEFTVLRDSTTFNSIITPQEFQGKYVIGVGFGSDVHPQSLISAIGNGFSKTGVAIAQTFIGLKMLVLGQANLKDLAGPVGIVQLASSQFQQNIAAFLGLMGFISISLGVINMFPFPVLDGGHFVFLLIEAIQGKPVNSTLERVLSTVGTICLVALMITVVFNDVLQWTDRVSIINKMTTP